MLDFLKIPVNMMEYVEDYLYGSVMQTFSFNHNLILVYLISQEESKY